MAELTSVQQAYTPDSESACRDVLVNAFSMCRNECPH